MIFPKNPGGFYKFSHRRRMDVRFFGIASRRAREKANKNWG
jgi:hypothetical protein